MPEPIESVRNSIQITLNETDVTSVIVNGVEIAGMIERGISLVTEVSEFGSHDARLTVTFPVSLP